MRLRLLKDKQFWIKSKRLLRRKASFDMREPFVLIHIFIYTYFYIPNIREKNRPTRWFTLKLWGLQQRGSWGNTQNGWCIINGKPTLLKVGWFGGKTHDFFGNIHIYIYISYIYPFGKIKLKTSCFFDVFGHPPKKAWDLPNGSRTQRKVLIWMTCHLNTSHWSPMILVLDPSSGLVEHGGMDVEETHIICPLFK